ECRGLLDEEEGADGDDALAPLRDADAPRRRIDRHDLDVGRDVDGLRAQRDGGVARVLHPAQVDGDLEVLRRQRAQLRSAPAQADAHRVGDGGGDHEGAAHADERERRGEGALGDDLAPRRGDDEPDQERETQRQHLQETARKNAVAVAVPLAQGAIRSLSMAVSASVSRFSCSTPSAATATEPFSSETTTTSASLSSLKPSAARCRVPWASFGSGVAVSGRSAPAATMRFPRTITAPSCIGAPGLKMGTRSSRLTRASSGFAAAAYMRRLCVRSMAMSAPKRFAESAVVAPATASTAIGLLPRRKRRSSGFVPTRARARR